MDPSAASTPASSPGLFSPHQVANQRSQSTFTPEVIPQRSPYLHPLQMHRPVKETHKASVEQDFITGRKIINQYEIIDEIGRGVHGKVKLARSLETGDFVAIKIIQRFSKKRRLGRVTVSPEDKTKREIAILKKIRHPNVVGLLEVIDDPELKKIYMVLEHVELGEVVWRKKGVREICDFERKRVDSEACGKDTTNDEKFFILQGRRRMRKEGLQQAKLSQLQSQFHEPWSLEYGNEEDGEEEFDQMATVNAIAMPQLSRQNTHESLARSMPRSNASGSAARSNPGSRINSRATSRAPSRATSRTSSVAHTPMPPDFQIGPADEEQEEAIQGSLPNSLSAVSSAVMLEGSMYGSYMEDPPPDLFRQRSPSMADSIISHMSSIDGLAEHDAFEDDFSYVPCFTVDQARSTFRDTVLGLEYLHYEGIVHRDIKPANLLWTRDHRVKISDFGVSYFGRPIRDGENEEQVSETDAEDFDDDLELAKTVGTPAFFAPELCYTGEEYNQPKVNEMIDVWSLGVTLYCLIYARIPFMAEDEFQLFRAIATEPVFIPRRRLVPVDPSYHDSEINLSKRIGPTTGQYREDGELRIEDLPEELHDLLSKMLQKDPRKRIKLKEVKLHPWVVKGIDNLPQWIGETDPARRGRRIQVNEGELEQAVVPLTFLERARSALKKVSRMVVPTRSERGEGSRRRALSSATSSAGDISHQALYSPGQTPMREQRRSSLRGDELHLNHARDLQHFPTEHPLAQSVTASPDDSAALDDPFAQSFFQNRSPLPTPLRQSSSLNEPDAQPQPPQLDRTTSNANSITTVIHRTHSHSRSFSGNMPTPEPVLEEIERVDSPSNSSNFHGFFTLNSRHKGLSNRRSDGNLIRTLTQPPERALFTSENKHGDPSLAICTTAVPGDLVKPPKLMTSTVNTPVTESIPPSPHYFPPFLSQMHHSDSTYSAPALSNRSHAASPFENRPSTIQNTPEARSPAPRIWAPSTVDSFARAQEQMDRRRQMEIVDERQNMPPPPKPVVDTNLDSQMSEQDIAAQQPCPVSPDDEVFFHKQERHRKERTKSTGSVQSTGVSPLTSASDVMSPTSSRTLASSQEQSFASDPSLPALVSGASSVSADADFEFMKLPGMAGIASLARVPESPLATDDTPATLTPDLPPKVSESDNDAEGNEGSFTISSCGDVFDSTGNYTSAHVEDYDSDSDEGLTMGRSKKPALMKGHPGRRGTNASVGSNETAKKVTMTE